MAEFGDYQILEELHRGPLGTVLRARLAGESGDFAVKVFDPAMMGLLEADAATQTFLDRVGMQKLLASRGARRWAPIHELKTTAEGAFYVTDYYPLSAKTLVANKTPISAQSLMTILSGVLKGLLELRARRRRAHGNLKPGNVLISGRVDALHNALVFLTDPATEADKPEDVADDMLSLGELIYELVMHRPYRPVTPIEDLSLSAPSAPATEAKPTWPVPLSAEWARLGHSAARWRDLCNWLLTPNAAGRPADLGEVVEALRNLMQRREVPTRKLAVVAGVPLVLFVLMLIGASVLVRLHSSARNEFAAVTGDWFTPFELSLRDPARRQTWRADPDLKPLVDEIERAQSAGISFDPPTGSLLNIAGYRRTRAALATVSRIRQQLSPENWHRLGELIALQHTYQARRWEQPAAFLTQLTHEAQPGPALNPAPGIGHLLIVQSYIDSTAPPAEQAWAILDADLKSIEAPHDPILNNFAEALRRIAIEPIRLGYYGLEGLEGMQTAGPLASRLAAVVRTGFPENYGRERFAQDFEGLLNTIQPKPANIQEWLTNVDKYALVTLDADAKPLVEVRERLKRLEEDIKRQPLSPEQLSAFDQKRQQLQSQIDAFAGTRFIRKDLTAQQGGEVANRLNAIRKDLDATRQQWITREDPSDWLASIDSPLTADSVKLHQRWGTWTEWLKSHEKDLQDDLKVFAATREQTKLVKAKLSALDDAFPKVLGISPLFVDKAWIRRENVLWKLSEWAVPPANISTLSSGLNVPPDAQIAAQIGKFSAWLGNVRELANDFPLRKDILTAEDRPDLKWEQKDKEFWNDPDIQAAVQPYVERINALAAVATAGREDVVDLAAGRSRKTPPAFDPATQNAEVALAAWRRLGDPALEWPTRHGELETERELRGRMSKMAETLKNADVVAALRADLKQEPPKRWRRYVSAADPDILAADPNFFYPAVAYQADFGASPTKNADELRKLAPAARFNLALWNARDAIKDPSPPRLTASVDELSTAARSLVLPELAGLPERLRHYNQSEPIAARLRQANISAAGPTITLPIPGSPYSLKFVRMPQKDIGGIRPFYLGTTEVSIGMFVDIVTANVGWTQANALLGGTSAVRHGPVAWPPAPSASVPIKRFDIWQFDNGKTFDFDHDLLVSQFNRSSLRPQVGGNPLDEHPMQQVPAQAAVYVAGLTGCRFPTVREWLAAYNLEPNHGSDSDWNRWNLRDATFRVQQNHTKKYQLSQWPDEQLSGVFRPAEPDRAAQMRPESNDRTLFFKPVEEPVVSSSAADATASASPSADGAPIDRRVFYHLVGNVAEFVCDSVDVFDSRPVMRTSDEVSAFLGSLGDRSLSVIGGSAFSAPELDVAKPYKLGSFAEPYADVGFRLAFTAPAKDDSERLKWVLEEQQYLRPPTASGKILE